MLNFLIDILNFLKLTSPGNSLLGYFIKANCKELQLHKDGYYDLIHILDEHKTRLQNPAGKVPFALIGTIDLTQRENIAFCKLCMLFGVEINCDTITCINTDQTHSP